MERLLIGQQAADWVIQRINRFGDFGSCVGIALQKYENGEWQTVAGVVYEDYNGPNIVAHIASDGSKRWLTRKFLWVMFDYPFNQAKVNRVTCYIGSRNDASINLCERLGFERETTLAGAHPDGDLHIYRLWKKDCKWLSLYPVLAKAA